jgi:hypothetical protein
MYIGQWQADKRHGYGVCDDIPRGSFLILHFHLDVGFYHLFFCKNCGPFEADLLNA